MKIAKRFLSLILVLALMLSSGITLYADGGGTGSSEEAKYTVTINRGPDVPSDADLGIQYWDTSIYQWVNWTEGTQLKEGTSIRGNSLNAVSYTHLTLPTNREV